MCRQMTGHVPEQVSLQKRKEGVEEGGRGQGEDKTGREGRTRGGRLLEGVGYGGNHAISTSAHLWSKAMMQVEIL